MLGFKSLIATAAQAAMRMVQGILAAQFRHGTPARSRMRTHDRKDGPNSRTSIHMLVRAVNAGYDYGAVEKPHWGSIGRSLRPQ